MMRELRLICTTPEGESVLSIRRYEEADDYARKLAEHEIQCFRRRWAQAGYDNTHVEEYPA
jgi:hypothetical protein